MQQLNPTALPIIVASALGAILSVLIYRKMQTGEETAMAKMKLKAETAEKEFKTLYLLHIYETAVLALVAVGGIKSIEILIDIGRGLTIFYIIGLLAVLYRWYRRF
ncbi:MAG: hypothetical protein ABEJ93_01565 [Candidatus Nanohalobium sp.]